jgi:hypothetical protein
MRRISTPVLLWLLGLTAAFAAASCTATSSGGGAAGNSFAAAGASAAGMSAASSGASVSFGEVYGILSSSCGGGGCHVSSAGAAGLSMLNKSTAYSNLVGVSSSHCRGQQRVVAGNPDMSVLVHALEHTSFATCRPPAMPQGRPMLNQSQIDTISTWIADGAPNN